LHEWSGHLLLAANPQGHREAVGFGARRQVMTRQTARPKEEPGKFVPTPPHFPALRLNSGLKSGKEI